VSSVHFLCAQCEWRLARSAGEAASACENCGRENGVTAPSVEALIQRCAVFVPWTHYLSLLAVTILDYIIWRQVKDVTVCYDCQAVHRGYALNPEHKPFDLVVHDRHVYGQAPPGAEEKGH
jgi:hypothetical protein